MGSGTAVGTGRAAPTNSARRPPQPALPGLQSAEATNFKGPRPAPTTPPRARARGAARWRVPVVPSWRRRRAPASRDSGATPATPATPAPGLRCVFPPAFSMSTRRARSPKKASSSNSKLSESPPLPKSPPPPPPLCRPALAAAGRPGGPRRCRPQSKKRGARTGQAAGSRGPPAFFPRSGSSLKPLKPEQAEQAEQPQTGREAGGGAFCEQEHFGQVRDVGHAGKGQADGPQAVLEALEARGERSARSAGPPEPPRNRLYILHFPLLFFGSTLACCRSLSRLESRVAEMLAPGFSVTILPRCGWEPLPSALPSTLRAAGPGPSLAGRRPRAGRAGPPGSGGAARPRCLRLSQRSGSCPFPFPLPSSLCSGTSLGCRREGAGCGQAEANSPVKHRLGCKLSAGSLRDA